MKGGDRLAHEGTRKLCLCIESMDLVVGKKKQVIFQKGEKYPCVIRGDANSVITYKVYGTEFDLSCSETEFKRHFNILFRG